MKGSCED